MEAESASAYKDADLYRYAMIGADTLWQVEAAVRLVYQSEDLWRFLVQGNFIRRRDPNSENWDILYMDALASAAARDSGVSNSDQVVLEIAASLVGECEIKLRHALPTLGERSAKLVAEAIMYASGYMDGEADPEAHDGPDGSSGPNRLEFERRVSCDY